MILIAVWWNKMKSPCRFLLSLKSWGRQVSFHLLSPDVGAVKPFETATVNKGYANKLDFKAPTVYIAPCIGFYKAFQDNSWELCWNSIFIQRENKHPHLRVLALCSFFFFSSGIVFLSHAELTICSRSPSMSLKSHCCILNDLCLVTSPLPGEGRLLDKACTEN